MKSNVYNLVGTESGFEGGFSSFQDMKISPIAQQKVDVPLAASILTSANSCFAYTLPAHAWEKTALSSANTN